MRDTTFGNSEAAMTLAVLLTKLNNPKVSRSVSRYLISQSEIAAQYNMHIRDTSLAELFRRWWLADIQAIKLTGVEGKIESFMKNVARAKVPPVSRNT